MGWMLRFGLFGPLPGSAPTHPSCLSTRGGAIGIIILQQQLLVHCWSAEAPLASKPGRNKKSSLGRSWVGFVQQAIIATAICSCVPKSSPQAGVYYCNPRGGSGGGLLIQPRGYYWREFVLMICHLRISKSTGNNKKEEER